MTKYGVKGLNAGSVWYSLFSNIGLLAANAPSFLGMCDAMSEAEVTKRYWQLAVLKSWGVTWTQEYQERLVKEAADAAVRSAVRSTEAGRVQATEGEARQKTRAAALTVAGQRRGDAEYTGHTAAAGCGESSGSDSEAEGQQAARAAPSKRQRTCPQWSGRAGLSRLIARAMDWASS
jgi:hypothetical protein